MYIGSGEQNSNGLTDGLRYLIQKALGRDGHITRLLLQTLGI